MNVHVKFDKVPSMTLNDIKLAKHYRQTQAHTRMNNVKTVYPPTNTVRRGYN